MARTQTDYFALIQAQTAYCVEASDLLETIFGAFQPTQIPAYRRQMHEIENAADHLRYDILQKLSVAFLTPIDQEDILRLVQILDDITDAIDEVVQDMYMYHMAQIPREVASLSHAVNRCIKALHEATGELKHFKKPDKLHALLARVNEIETEADRIYIEAIHELFAHTTEEKTLLGIKAVCEALEDCCDLCEHAADGMEQILVK